MYWAKTEHPVISDYVEEREQCEDWEFQDVLPF
jgi:hypothetical protein